MSDILQKKKQENVIKLSWKVSVIDEHINIRTLFVGPFFSGETYLMLKTLSRLPDRVISSITKSCPEQYSNSSSKIEEIGEEIKSLNEYNKTSILFDDFLVSSNSRYIDQFLIRGRHNNLNNYYLSHYTEK